MRLIDADAYKTEMNNRQTACAEWRDEARVRGDDEIYYRADGALSVFCEAKLTLDKMPTVDAVPVKHGEWQDKIVAFYRKCSVCGCCVEWDKKPFLFANGEYNYCPNCGAKMDGGKDDE